MKKIRKLLLLLTILPSLSFAQGVFSSASPVMWDFSVTAPEAGTYRIRATAVLQPGFHIWALDAGGDGSLIATSFTMIDLQQGTWVGEWTESKDPVIETLEFIEGAIRWHEQKVTFYRDIKAPAGSEVKGSVVFQTCNDQMCFPPEDLEFELELP